MSPRLFYRSVAIAEAVTWTMLIIGLVLKYVVQSTDLGVQVGGAAHGIVFVAYCMTAVLVGVNQRWSVPLIFGSLAVAVIPWATIPLDRWLDRRRLLAGGWRRTASDDPRDSTPVDRMLRWLLRHPALLTAAFVVALVVIVTVLLILGPPGGRE